MSNKKPVKVKIIKHEIDYERLENTIANAIKKSEEPIEKANNTQKFSLFSYFRALFIILFNKKETHGLTNSFFTFIVSVVFKLFGYLGCLISFAICIYTIYHSFCIDWSLELIKSCMIEFLSYLLFFVISVVVFSLSVLLVGASREIEKEKDKNYIIAIFSGIVSFSALVVALVALFKGVE